MNTTTTDTDTATAVLVDRLWSIHQIQQLAYRFAQAHDGRDMAELERLFVPAAELLDFPEFNQANVLSTLPEYFRFAGPTVLFVANHIIDFVDNDRATGSVYCFAKLDIGGVWVEQAIQYQDIYQREPDGWRFAMRRHLLWYGIEQADRPFDQPKTQWPAGATGRGSLPEDFATWRDFYGITEAPIGFYGQPDTETTFS
ncbi:MAG: nuclear transport factor 2 family protein [Microbacteriaceae bacterium]